MILYFFDEILSPLLIDNLPRIRLPESCTQGIYGDIGSIPAHILFDFCILLTCEKVSKKWSLTKKERANEKKKITKCKRC